MRIPKLANGYSTKIFIIIDVWLILIFTVGTQISQQRLSHTDIRVPDFDNYRKDFLKDPTMRSRDYNAQKGNFGYFVATGNYS